MFNEDVTENNLLALLAVICADAKSKPRRIEKRNMIQHKRWECFGTSVRRLHRQRIIKAHFSTKIDREPLGNACRNSTPFQRRRLPLVFPPSFGTDNL